MDRKPIENTTLWKVLLRLNKEILILATASAAILVFVGVLMRYVFETDFYGSEEIITIAAMWMYYFGGSYGSFEDTHIKADIVSALVKKEKIKKIINIITYFISSVVLLIFAIWGMQFVAWNLEKEVTSLVLKIPLFFSQIPLVIGFLLMLFFTVYHLVRRIQSLKTTT